MRGMRVSALALSCVIGAAQAQVPTVHTVTGESRTALELGLTMIADHDCKVEADDCSEDAACAKAMGGVDIGHNFAALGLWGCLGTGMARVTEKGCPSSLATCRADAACAKTITDFSNEPQPNRIPQFMIKCLDTMFEEGTLVHPCKIKDTTAITLDASGKASITGKLNFAACYTLSVKKGEKYNFTVIDTDNVKTPLEIVIGLRGSASPDDLLRMDDSISTPSGEWTAPLSTIFQIAMIPQDEGIPPPATDYILKISRDNNKTHASDLPDECLNLQTMLIPCCGGKPPTALCPNNNGMPTSCTAACAAKILPFYQKCSTTGSLTYDAEMRADVAGFAEKCCERVGSNFAGCASHH